MGQRKRQPASSEIASKRDLIETLHPSLRATFTPLPQAGEPLTDEQLAAIFSGDLKALKDVVRLIQPVVEY